MTKTTRNPRQVSEARLESALKCNTKWARHFSYIYSYPDWQELESIGLEAITDVCVRVRKTQRHKGFLSLCRKAVRADINNYLKKKNLQNGVLGKARRRLGMTTRDPDKYMPDWPEKGMEDEANLTYHYPLTAIKSRPGGL